MKPSLTEILNLCGDLLGYVFWIGGTLWILKRSVEIHREVDAESAEALRVPTWLAWLLTGKKDVTVVSLGGIAGLILALFWFTLSALAGKYILNIWIYYIFWFSGVLAGIWFIVFSIRHIMWWWRDR